MISVLLEAAARALALALITYALLWMLRVKNVAAQRTAWTIVLFAAFAMPLLMQSPWVPAPLQWRPNFSAPQTPTIAPATAPARAPVTYVRSAVGLGSRTASLPPSAKPLQSRNEVPAWRPTPALFFALYAAITGVLLTRLLVGLVSAWRIWRRSTPIAADSNASPSVRVSAEVLSPVTIGSGILLPSEFDQWSPERLRAVLAHERAHVRHFDFHLQLLAGIYAAIFWFSPLGWWLRRHLAVLAEAISDQAGIAESGTRSDYAEIVLHFAAMPRRSMTGVAMASSGNVTRRIEQLLNEDLYRAAFSRGQKRARIAFLLVTFAVFTTSLLMHVPSARAAQKAPAPPPMVAVQLETPAPPASAPEPPQAPEATNNTNVNSNSNSNSNSNNNTNTLTETRDANSTTYSYGVSDDGNSYSDGESYAIVDGTKTNMTFSGHWASSHSREEIEKARRVANNGKFLWFHHAGKSYVVTDPTIIANLQALYAPMEELGRQQEELGKQQEALGEQQEALGRKQEEASVPTPDMTREIAAINEAAAKLQAQKGKDMTSEQLADLQEKLGDLQGRLGEVQGKIGEKQGKLGEEQGKLGEQQGKLGEKQGKLGEQQGKIAEAADKKVKAVIQETLRNGKAQPVQ
ncbi:peptidase M56, BlaR1 [Candidatus Koribacter versatilis Ellin345]|uniref:Peptidase M56, BlaR1 n=1 Tax=Koribacter versatilis (strain Ellin345) TaxID=204669 RepID=Q1IJR2_KORVE|nr:M56 family metallopeptidase [Candidatus Koribacter versatilis]ABF42888.1 peptidase M56, BlaR1 [Candidatus Koribacter versatilis Ellin345]